MSRITIGGLIATAIYVALIITYVASDVAAIWSLKPNEMGDFLAGTFGPLAFFWLICGYLQQGAELKQNTEALRLQVEELRNSVEHQREMAAVARAQLVHDAAAQARADDATRRNALPIFDIVDRQTSVRSEDIVEEFKIRNSGDYVRLMQLRQSDGVPQLIYAPFHDWDTGDEKVFKWATDAPEGATPFDVTFSFVDRLGNAGTATIHVGIEPSQIALGGYYASIRVSNPD